MSERTGFMERLSRLQGQTAWRQPLEGHATDGGSLPDTHALAACFGFARSGPRDVGPDILYSIACQRPARAEAVVVELEAVLLMMGGATAKRCQDRLSDVAKAAYIEVCTERDMSQPPQEVEIDARDWLILTSIACKILWGAAEYSLMRAEKAYRSN